MKKILLINHYGSHNHDYEAQVRALLFLLKKIAPTCQIELFSFAKQADKKYLADLNDLNFSGYNNLPARFSPRAINYRWQKYMQENTNALPFPIEQNFKTAVAAADIVIALGGDNYRPAKIKQTLCYDNYVKKQNKPFILVGFSLYAPHIDAEIIAHLRSFDFVAVSERLTFAALKERGLSNILLNPDPGFVIEKTKTQFPSGFAPQNTVGINISSSLIATESDMGIVRDNYRHLIRYLLGSTKLQIALIPHNVSPGCDDRPLLRSLHQEFANDFRIIIMDDLNIKEQKYIISNLKFFIGCYQQAMIAALSCQVPSIAFTDCPEIEGITRELFDDKENFVLLGNQLKHSEQLRQSFVWLEKNEQTLRQRLQEIMPSYLSLSQSLTLYLDRIYQDKEIPFKTEQSSLPSKNICTGCSLCQASCPAEAISMCPDNKGFSYPAINQELCQKCSLCIKVCPANKHYQPIKPQVSYAAYLQDTDTRLQSSSGGLFSPLALDLLLHGGYVCGAAYDHNLRLRHIIIDNPTDIPKLRGSKYIQSDISEVLPLIKQIIEAKRPILFCGTPCQTAAVRALVGDSDYLLTVGLICHGVPSPLAFKAYLEEEQKARNMRISFVDFRNKSRGWQNFLMRLYFGGGNYKDYQPEQNPYMQAFYQNVINRPSCSNCFSRQMLAADLIIGDFWGVDKIAPNLHDDKGISLVIPYSEKGIAALKGIIPHLIIEKVDFMHAAEHNPVLRGSLPTHPKQEQFFADISTLGFTDSLAAVLAKPATEASPSILNRLKQVVLSK